MFYWLTFLALLLAALALWQSIRVERKAHKKRLEAIRKQIEENDKKKALKKLQQASDERRNNTPSEDNESDA